MLCVTHAQFKDINCEVSGVQLEMNFIYLLVVVISVVPDASNLELHHEVVFKDDGTPRLTVWFNVSTYK